MTDHDKMPPTFDERWGSLSSGEGGNGGEGSCASLVTGTDPEVILGVLFKPGYLVILVGTTVHLVEPVSGNNGDVALIKGGGGGL